MDYKITITLNTENAAFQDALYEETLSTLESVPSDIAGVIADDATPETKPLYDYNGNLVGSLTTENISASLTEGGRLKDLNTEALILYWQNKLLTIDRMKDHGHCNAFAHSMETAKIERILNHLHFIAE